MAEKSSPISSAYAFDNEEANQKYQAAYDQLIAAIDARQQKPMFDPTWLAAAQGFLTPNKTGSFFESLGNVAGNVNRAQQDEQTKAQELARMKLELAGMGIQQANQRSAMRMYREGEEKPSGPPAQPTTESDVALRSMGIEDQGVQMFPPQPLIPKSQFIASQLLKGGSVPDAQMAYDKYLRDDIQLAQNGMVIQRSTGKGFDMPDPTPVSVPFLSLNGDPFQVTKTQARRLDQYAREGNNEARIAYENQLRGIRAPKPAEAPQQPAQPPAQPPLQMTPQTGAITTPAVKPVAPPSPIASPPVPSSVAPAAPAPAAPPPAAPGMKTPAQLAREKAEADQRMAIAQAIAIEEGKAKVAAGVGADAKFQETVGGKRGEAAVAEENRIAQNAQNAGKLFTAADMVINSVKQSPNYFGVFNKPGALNAVGSMLAEVGKPGGKFTLVDVEGQVVKLMPGTTKDNLLDREKAASALAEIELGYTQTYLAKQGAVTEGERKIVRAIPGGLSSSPQFLEIKSKLIKERAQYDMDINTAYSEYLKANPRGNALDFQRNSPLYKEIHNAFERKTAELAGTIPALPTKERKSSGPAKGNEASSYVEDLLKRRGQQ
jgi:hypothetical protein